MSFYTDKIKLLDRIAFNCIQRSCTEKTSTVPCEKSNTVSFASSIIRKIVVFPALSKFAVKLIF